MIDGRLLAIGPFVPLIILVWLLVVFAVAYWLVSTGITKRSGFRILLGTPVAAYFCAVLTALFFG